MAISGHIAERIGPAIYVIGGLAWGGGYVLSRMGIAFGEDVWLRLSELRRASKLWARLCLAVSAVFSHFTVISWAFIGLCALVDALIPGTVLQQATLGLATASRGAGMAYSPTQHVLILIFALAAILSVPLVLDWFSHSFEDDANYENSPIGSLGAAGFAIALPVAAIGSLALSGAAALYTIPAVATFLVERYQDTSITQIAAFALLSTRVCIVPTVLVTAAAMQLLVTFRNWYLRKPLSIAYFHRRQSYSLTARLVGILGRSLVRFTNFFLIFAPSAAISMVWTLCMLILGNRIQHEIVSVTVQLFVANAVCDGTAIYLSVIILSWAGKHYYTAKNFDELMSDWKQAKLAKSTNTQYRKLITLAFTRLFTDMHVLGRIDRSDDKKAEAARKAAKPKPARWLSSSNAEYYLSKNAPHESMEENNWRWLFSSEDIWRPTASAGLQRAQLKHIIPAFVGTFVLNAILAYSALFLSLWRTKGELPERALDRIYIGGFDGRYLNELGPLFWVTHSSLIPTMILWLAIVLIFLAAYVINPLGDFIARIGRATLVNPKTGLMKYGIALTAIGEGIDQTVKLLMG